LVYSIHYSTEEDTIKKMVEASQRMITMNSQGQEELGGINPAMKARLELQIKRLQNAPRCRQVRTAFEIKTEGKGECNVYRRHT
jgi:hypothetical protein